MAEKKEKIIYISGHRNPDTDSICSAMALADAQEQDFEPDRWQMSMQIELCIKLFGRDI